MLLAMHSYQVLVGMRASRGVGRNMANIAVLSRAEAVVVELNREQAKVLFLASYLHMGLCLHEPLLSGGVVPPVTSLGILDQVARTTSCRLL